MQVAVCGPAAGSASDSEAAFRVGQLLAQQGHTVLCGGGGGVMAAVAAGARGEGGFVVSIRPGPEPGAAAPHASVVITTNLGEARNAVLVASADAVIAIGGSWGTLSEVALAMRRARDLPAGALPVVCLGGWRILDPDGKPIPGVLEANDAEHAVALATGTASARSERQRAPQSRAEGA